MRYRWIVWIFLLMSCEEVNLAGSNSEADVPEECQGFSDPATYCEIQYLILIPKCVRCHERGRFPLGETAAHENLMALSNWVRPNSLNGSRLYLRMEANQITDTVISDAEVDAMASWILSGAENN